jgi:hypothetical protein
MRRPSHQLAGNLSQAYPGLLLCDDGSSHFVCGGTVISRSLAHVISWFSALQGMPSYVLAFSELHLVVLVLVILYVIVYSNRSRCCQRRHFTM